MFLVSIFLKILDKNPPNVSIWSSHISWSVHPWRKKIYQKQALKPSAERMVSLVYRQRVYFQTLDMTNPTLMLPYGNVCIKWIAQDH